MFFYLKTTDMVVLSRKKYRYRGKAIPLTLGN